MNMPGEKKPNHSKGYGIFLGWAKFIIFVLIAILIVFFIIYLSVMAYSLGYESTAYEPVTTESEAVEIEITITRDMTASDIGQMLIDEGVIDESLQAFLIQDRLSGLHGEYVAGTYTLSTALTVDEILQIICTEEES